MRRAHKLDPDDPLAKCLKRVKLQLVKMAVWTLVLGVIVIVFGVPHFQVSYEYVGSSRRYVPPERRHKTSADYLGPLGWQKVRRSDALGELTVIKFLPLHGCVDFTPYGSTFPFSLLPEEYRDGQSAR